MSAAPLRIVELRATNVMRLRAVTIRPDEHGNLVVLGGRNGQGKTTVLKCIEMAFGGAEQIPPEPVRRGSDSGEIVIDLGEIVVRRTFTAAGGTHLVVSNKEGARFQSPQTLLETFYSRVAFDPLTFARETGKRQAEILRDLLGLDFAKVDARRAETYLERAGVNRQANTQRVRLEALPQHEGVPAEPVSAAGIAEQLQQAQAANSRAAALRAEYSDAERDVITRRKGVEALRAQIDQAERGLRAAEALAEELLDVAKNAPEFDLAPLQAQMREVDATNAKVQANLRRAEAVAELAATQQKADDLTAEIETIDGGKAQVIAAAAMPVPGLGFSPDGGVTLDGIPLEQASGAERIRVSVAIGLAMNPRLRVLLIRDASLLDSHSMRLVAAMAQASGSQLWLERVDVDQDTTVLIEDGEAIEPQAGTPRGVGVSVANTVDTAK